MYTITLNINIPITCNKYKGKPISTNNRSIFSKSIYVYIRGSTYYVPHFIKSFNSTKLIEFCAIRHHRYTEMFLVTDPISIRLCSYIFHKNWSEIQTIEHTLNKNFFVLFSKIFYKICSTRARLHWIKN